MINRDFKIIKNMTNTVASRMGDRLDTLSPTLNNTNFCKSIVEKSNGGWSVQVDSFLKNKNKSNAFKPSSNLVYIKKEEVDPENDPINIILRLLQQMRAFQDGQNSFMKNSLMMKQSIMEQLERELLFARNKIGSSTTNEIKNIVINNKFNASDLERLISSLSDLKKKK